MKIYQRILTGILLEAVVSVRADASRAGDQAASETREAMADRLLVFDAIIRDQASCPEVSTAELSPGAGEASDRRSQRLTIRLHCSQGIRTDEKG